MTEFHDRAMIIVDLCSAAPTPCTLTARTPCTPPKPWLPARKTDSPCVVERPAGRRGTQRRPA
eukprot:6241357-Lingulodinium_polyedra.AAC.1